MSPSESEHVDGAENPFQFEAADVETSRTKRLRQTLDTYVYAPGKIAWNDWRARYGIFILLAYVLMGTVGVLIVPEPGFNQAEPFIQPFENLAFPLGTDQFGQGLARQIVHASPPMFKMIFAGALVSVGLAMVIGITAGYKGGLVDQALMGLTDVVLTIPGLPLIIIIASVYELRNPFVVGLVLGIDNWPGLARALRSQVLAVREESYIEASRAMGIRTPNIIAKEITPQLMPYVLVNSASAAQKVIFESVGLYFLGILPFTTLNWGVMMNMAYSQGGALADFSRAHWLFIPALTIAGIAFGLILFSQGMDQIFNPRLRARHEKTSEDEPPAASADD